MKFPESRILVDELFTVVSAVKSRIEARKPRRPPPQGVRLYGHEDRAQPRSAIRMYQGRACKHAQTALREIRQMLVPELEMQSRFSHYGWNGPDFTEELDHDSTFM